LYVSPAYGHLLENLALIEVIRFFQNRGIPPEVHFLRSKEKVEVDFLIRLTNDRWLAMEVKSTPVDFSEAQLKLLKSTDLNVVDRWVASPSSAGMDFKQSRSVHFTQIHERLAELNDE